MVFVSVTRLRIRSVRFVPQFAWHTVGTLAQIKRAAGFVTGSLLPDRNRVFWTLTAWEDGADMRRYMTGGAHLKAMPKLLGWCDEASVVHWLQDDPQLPGWDVADARMRSQGRPSKVRNPGPHHLDLSYREPRLTGAVPIKAR